MQQEEWGYLDIHDGNEKIKFAVNGTRTEGQDTVQSYKLNQQKS